MPMQEFWQKVFVDRHLAAIQGRQFFFVIVYHNDIVAKVRETCARD
jgi:hypothetical protein